MRQMVRMVRIDGDGDDGEIGEEEIYHFPRVGLIRRIHGSGVSL